VAPFNGRDCSFVRREGLLDFSELVDDLQLARHAADSQQFLLSFGLGSAVEGGGFVFEVRELRGAVAGNVEPQERVVVSETAEKTAT